MKVKIEIDTKTFVRFWLVVIGLGLAGFALYSARTALLIIGSALFLALALETPVTPAKAQPLTQYNYCLCIRCGDFSWLCGAGCATNCAAKYAFV